MVRKIKNAKQFKQLKKKELKVIPVYNNSKYKCPNGHLFDIDYNKKHYPMKPEKLKNKLVAIPTAMNIECPICNVSFSINLPVKKEKRKFYIFGDEAYRGDDGKSKYFICNYSLVGVNSKKLIEAENRVLEFKLKYFPQHNPWDWKIHLKDLSSTTHREKHDLFKSMSGTQVKTFIKELYSLIKEMVEKEELTIISSTILNNFNNIHKNRKQTEKELKKLSYELAIFHTMDYLTENEINPCYIFDSEKKSNEVKVIQQWAEDIFDSGQYSLACAFFFKGIDVEKPIFVKPASRVFLEIADFVCYTMARFLDFKLNKPEKENELYNPSKFGSIIYNSGVKNKKGFFYGHSNSLDEFLSQISKSL